MNPIDDILARYPLLVIDGALATELERRGCDLNDPLWSARILLLHPTLIEEVHESYLRAGADCLITASYQATSEGFRRRGMSEEEAQDLIRLSVSLARRVRDRFWSDPANRKGRPRPLVAASVGPYGAYLADGSEYRGEYDIGETGLVDFHRNRLRTLVAAGPDLLACETIPCMQEARALVRLLADYQEVSCWVSFSCRDGVSISSGEPLAECARWLDSFPQIGAVGINCTPPEYVPSLIAEIRKATDKPVIVYPNSGEQYDVTDKRWLGSFQRTPFAEMARGWYEQGARLIGGCCRTTPEDIQEIAGWARGLSV